MILTVTMNPSIDTAYSLDHLAINDVNHVAPHKTAGGKGLNVSRVLVQLRDQVLATGLLGGHMGALLSDLMKEDNIPNDFTPIAGESRTCLSILHEGNQTELLESGPVVSEEELNTFIAHFTKLVEKASVVTMSGSLPRGLPANTYATLVAIARQNNVPVLLDTSGTSLKAALVIDTKPTLVKPNLKEINGLLNTSFASNETDKLMDTLTQDNRFAGIEWVVVSMGKDGSIALHNGKRLRAHSASIKAVNATGSGDSTIAGFAHAIAGGADEKTTLKIGNVCGTLNAMDLQTGHLKMDSWDDIFTHTTVEEF